MKNFIQTGESLSLTAPYGVASGGGMQVGSLFTVAKSAAVTGGAVEGMPRGVFDLPKVAGSAWTQGAKVYWDNTAKAVTITASTNLLIGVAKQAQASGDVLGRVFVMGLTA